MKNEVIKIGIIDSGVDTTACSLYQSVKAFCHIDDNGARTDKKYHDPSGHGTFNSALLTGESEHGPAPMIPNAELYVCAAIEGQNLALKSLEALEWMLEQPIDILLMPFGLKGNNPVLSHHLQALVDRGVLPIAAIGNEGAGRHRSPGCYSNVLSVGACHANGEVAAFSGSLNEEGTTECLKPDVACLGVEVESPYKKIGNQNGSSMASALLAGFAAQLWQKKPELTNHQMAQLLIQSAVPSLAGQEHRSKYGIVDVMKAKDSMYRIDSSHNELLTPVEYDKYVDPYLAQLAKGSSQKSVDFILVPSSTLSLSEIMSAYTDMHVKKTYSAGDMVYCSASGSTLSNIIEEGQAKLLQSVTVPFLNLS